LCALIAARPRAVHRRAGVARGVFALLVGLVLVAPGAAAGPRTDEVARAAAGMAAWPADPLAAADESRATCAAIAELGRGVGPGRSGSASAVGRAVTHFAASCSAYRQALASYPLEVLRRELYWRASLDEGVMVASEYWRNEIVASEGRLSALGVRWREAAGAAEAERRAGCAALATTGLGSAGLRRACPERPPSPPSGPSS
jgi:hypothetical protein